MTTISHTEYQRRLSMAREHCDRIVARIRQTLAWRLPANTKITADVTGNLLADLDCHNKLVITLHRGSATLAAEVPDYATDDLPRLLQSLRSGRCHWSDDGSVAPADERLLRDFIDLVRPMVRR